MAKLVFRVAADYEEVIKLRNEIAKLKSELKGMDASDTPHVFNTLNAQLQRTTKRMDEMVHEAAQAGAEMEHGFKKKIFDASQEVNRFTEQIIEQKAVVKDVQADVRKLGDRYRMALKNNPIGSSSIQAEWQAAKRALEEEKAALFGLTQEQAKARLSVKQLRDEYALFKKEGGDAKEAITDIADSMKGWAAGILGGIGIKEFIGKMIQVRGEFQAADTAIQTLLGSKEKADALMSQVREYAKISPLEFSDVTAATQMMLGFNIEAEKVPKFLAAIGDVSMGETQKFNSLTLAFSQMSATGKLMGQDLNQMINAGFNPLQAMADKTGKSISNLKEEMSKGAITAEMVQQAFLDATSAGGKFYNMSENASKTINGQLSMMQDAMDAAFNEMGQKSEGVIMSGIQMTTKLIENYETVGKVLSGLVITYGTYKAALLTASVIESARNKTLLTNITATKAYTAAQGVLNAVMNANPYVLLTTAVVGLGTAMWALSKNAEAATRITNELEEAMGKAEASAIIEQRSLDQLRGKLAASKKGTKEYEEAKQSIINQFGKYNAGLEDELNTVGLTAQAYEQLSASIRKATMARALDAEMKAQNDTLQQNLTDSLKKMQESLLDDFGDVYGSEIYEKIRNSLAKGTIGTKLVNNGGYLEKQFTGIDEQTRVALEYNKGNNAANKALRSYLKAEEALKDAEQRIRQRYGVTDEVTTIDETVIIGNKNKHHVKTDKEKAKEKREAEKAKREAQARIQAEQRAADILTSITNSTEEKNNETIHNAYERRLAAINTAHKKEKEAIDKQAREIAEANKKSLKGIENTPEGKAKAATFKYDGLNEEQHNAIQAFYKANDEAQRKSIADVEREHMQAMLDYLKEYGTVQQQKYAIAKEYDEKIANANEEVQKKLLERQKQEALSNIASKDVMMSIDWRETFGNMGSVLKDIAKDTLAKVNDYMKSDSFKKLEAKDKKAYADLRSNLRSSLNNDNANVFSTKMWNDISTYTKEYQDSVKALQNATTKHEKAIDGLEKAEKELSKATTDKAKKIAKEKVESSKKEVNDTATEVKNRQQEVTDARENLNDGAEKAATSLQNFQTLLSNITNGSLTSFSKGVGQLINNIAGGSTKVGDAMQGLGGKIGGLVGAILSIIEALGDDPAGFIKNLVNKVVNAIENVLTNLDKITFSVFKGVGNLASGIIKATLSGATFGLYNAKGNVKDMNDRIKELKAANEELAKSIKDLAESISDNDSTNKDSVETYKKAVAAQKESNENQQEAIRAEARKYSSGGHGFFGLGGRSSFNVYANNNRNIWLSQFNEALRKNGYNTVLNDVSHVWNLTAEQLKAIRNYAPKAWAAFFNSGGEGNPKELVEEYIDSAAGAIDELTEKLNEKLTGYSWSGFKQNYESLLLDLESTTEDFGNNISEIINKALVNSFVNSPEMQKRIKKLYDYISNAASDGVLTENEVIEMRRQNEEIANYGILWRQAMEEAGLMKKESSSSSESAGSIHSSMSMTEDTANQIVGRITAFLLAQQQQTAVQQQQFVALTQIGGNISTMVNKVTGIYDIANDTRNILASSYLELRDIRENTGAIVVPIKQMQKDINAVKLHISNL